MDYGVVVGAETHDLRRSAAQALRLAGLPERVIMAAGGWKTPAMFRRYAIVSASDQRAAVEMLEQARAESISPYSPFSHQKHLDLRQCPKDRVQ